MAKKKSKKKSLPKRKPTAARQRKGARKLRVPAFKKRRGKLIYDIMFKKGYKSREEVLDVIKAQKFSRIEGNELPAEKVKLTFVAKAKNKFASITYIYDVDDLGEIELALEEIIDETFSRPTKRTTKSVKRMNRLKNFVDRVIIDFETID